MQMTEGRFMLLPPAADKCQECGTEHAAELPHNAQSLYYQTKFNMEHGRAATWLDAMAHCGEEMRSTWTAELVNLGVDVEGGAINPDRKRKGPRK